MPAPAQHIAVELTINGRKFSRCVEARRTLADFVREDAGLTGTHLGCEHGACGACTDQIDGTLARSCLTLAAQANGAAIRTVEGLATDEVLHPVQAAFKRHHALQCGFCTPGFLVAAVALLEENPDPTEHEVREWLNGNICRCTGYQFIIDAVLSAAAEMRGNPERDDASRVARIPGLTRAMIPLYGCTVPIRRGDCHRGRRRGTCRLARSSDLSQNWRVRKRCSASRSGWKHMPVSKRLG